MEAINPFVKPKASLKAALAKIIAQGTMKTRFLKLDPGEFLFREGDTVCDTFYITRGLVRVYSDTPEGHTKTVFFYTSGSLIGYLGFQPEGESNVSILNAQAHAKVEAYALDSKQFKEYLKAHGDICYIVVQYFLEMMELQTREAVNASIYSVLQRFSALLVILSKEFSSVRTPAILPFSNKDFAEMLGVHINSITNSTIALRDANCVERQHGAFAITDFKKLRAIAGTLIPKDY